MRLIQCSVVALASLVAACGNPTAPDRVPGAEPFAPKLSYAEWYADMEACSGVEGDFSRVNWFIVRGVSDWNSTYDGDVVPAEWWPPHDIYIAGRMRDDREIISHEILHDILQDPEHPVPPFGECAPESL